MIACFQRILLAPVGGLAVCAISKGFEHRFLGESKLFMIGFATGIYQVYDYWVASPSRSLS